MSTVSKFLLLPKSFLKFDIAAFMSCVSRFHRNYSNWVRGYTVLVSFIVIFSDETTESFSEEIDVGDNKTITAPVNGDGHPCPGDGRLVLSHYSAVPL